MPIIECVPNVSEGRRRDVVAAIADAMRGVQGVRLLDLSSDASHNRSVITVTGDGAALHSATLALFEAAIAHIDLRTHAGEHPRMGAVDVVPFIPIDGIAMGDCVALAREVGRVVASQFNLPVFLYEEAAASLSRRNLADIRRGEFEGLSAKLALPEWAPDFGPRTPHPSAGATAIGARMPLIAFNVNLDSPRLEIAKAIAARVRFSSGGLPHVKALGLSLADRGAVQVSMNLTNYLETPIRIAFDAVRREAAARGVSVLESEIVGLVPANALSGAAPGELNLVRFNPDQILENRIRRA